MTYIIFTVCNYMFMAWFLPGTPVISWKWIHVWNCAWMRCSKPTSCLMPERLFLPSYWSSCLKFVQCSILCIKNSKVKVPSVIYWGSMRSLVPVLWQQCESNGISCTEFVHICPFVSIFCRKGLEAWTGSKLNIREQCALATVKIKQVLGHICKPVASRSREVVDHSTPVSMY